MYILILIFKKLRNLLAGLYGHFFGREGSAFLSTMNFVLSLLLGIFIFWKINSYILKNNIFITFIKVYLWYFLSFALILVLYLILKKSEIILYILIFLVIIGVILDAAIIKIRKLICVAFLVIHLIFWNYSYWQTELLIIKELFWYSLILMSCFIWHVLIINWLYKVVDSSKWDYGRYLVSRISLVTSMTGIIWIILALIYILEAKYRYELAKELHPSAIRPKSLTRFIFTWSNLCLVLCHILLVICEYFSFIFQNYSKLLIGAGPTIKFWEFPVKFYLLIITTIIISIIIGIPRIYLIWVVLILWNIMEVLLSIPKYGWPSKEGEYLLNIILEDTRLLMLRKHHTRYLTQKNFVGPFKVVEYLWIDRLTSEWKLIYDEGLFRDYYWYSSLNYWHWGRAHHLVVIDIYQVWVDVFNYSEDRELKMLGRICYNYWIDSEIEFLEEIHKIEDKVVLERHVKHIQKYVYNYTLLFDEKEVIPYVEKAEQDCCWCEKNEPFAEGSWWKYASKKKYIYIS